MFGGCFSLFMNVSKPRPNDHPLLVLFIVGGVTCSEVHQIREALAAYHPNTQVSFSKSCFLTFVVAWSRAMMDIMGLWLMTGLSAGSSMLLFFFFGFRWQAVEGKRNRARKTAMGVMNARCRVHLARERLSSLAVFHCRDELIQLNPCSTHFL